MTIDVIIPEYSEDKGFQITWEHGFEIEAKIEGGSLMISANKAALVSIAKQLLTLAQDNVPKDYHYHLDEYNSLEEGSIPLIFHKL
ncbi:MULTISPECIES: Imm32 family immunity protein [unclassified Sphingobacterium]|uniref:Imm32 family immunity protein n=1 Tax=unclassified Sphingobacterium TaxID=2609468 RepID=UPI0025D9678C|nr:MULTISPECIES: hypothetical protein [unclassified Sphingobacterium]